MQCSLKALYPGPWPQQLCSLWETCRRADLNFILGSRRCFSQLATQQLSCQPLEWKYILSARVAVAVTGAGFGFLWGQRD